MGKLELRDLCGTLDWLLAEKPALCRSLSVFGLSIGASVTALASRPDVSAAVFESPLAGYHQVGGRWAWYHFRVPYFPMALLVMLWARLRAAHGGPNEFWVVPGAVHGK